jgi:signal recognition particle subunit SRP54
MMGMGGLTSLMDKLPGMGQLPENVRNQVNDKDMHHMLAIIRSMTPKERRFPDIIKGARRRRIAAGSGTRVQDVNRLLKQFTQMQKMMKKMSKGGMKNMMRGMKGRMPQGFPF